MQLPYGFSCRLSLCVECMFWFAKNVASPIDSVLIIPFVQECHTIDLWNVKMQVVQRWYSQNRNTILVCRHFLGNSILSVYSSEFTAITVRNLLFNIFECALHIQCNKALSPPLRTTKYQFRNIVKYICFSQKTIYTKILRNFLGWLDRKSVLLYVSHQ